MARYSKEVDVAIIGAGMAGSSLAIQLKQNKPSIQVTLLEANRFPMPDAAHKVGESTVEVGAHYFAKVLGLNHALRTAKMPKLGLRYFFNTGENPPIDERVEIGPVYFPTISAYNFDRGRMENILYEECRRLSVQVRDGTVVESVEFGPETHALRLAADGQSDVLRCRWLVDASGRRGFLRQKLGLREKCTHETNATWFRVHRPIVIDDACGKDSWRSQVPFDMRKISTTHLMGAGYWVWLIGLPSGSMSVGIVADDRLHPVVERSSLDKSMAWLRRYEPQCAELIEKFLPHGIMDFHAFKRLAYGCGEVFSNDRWALTGEAGVFVDPLYSPGSDFIAYSNDYITDFVLRDLRGEDVTERVTQFNQSYLNLYRSYVLLYQDEYDLLSNAEVVSAKIVWDFAIYWGGVALVYFQGRISDLEFSQAILPLRARLHLLNQQAQALLKWWHKQDRGGWCKRAFFDYLDVEFLYRWQTDLHQRFDDDSELIHKLEENVWVCEKVLVWMYRRATGTLDELDPNDHRVDPYRLDLTDSAVLAASRKRTLEGLAEEVNEFMSRCYAQRAGQRVEPRASSGPHSAPALPTRTEAAGAVSYGS